MPYIKTERRKELDGLITKLAEAVNGVGEMNYAVTKFFHAVIKSHNLNYTLLNSTIGVLECAKLELYRMVVGPYENKKRMLNGSISDLDIKNFEDVR